MTDGRTRPHLLYELGGQRVGTSHQSAPGSSSVASAAMESFFSSLKTERTARKTYQTRGEAKADVFDDIERFCNPKRRHSTLGYVSPIEFEKQRQ